MEVVLYVWWISIQHTVVAQVPSRLEPRWSWLNV